MKADILIQEGFRVKMQISALTDRLHGIHRQIAELALYRDGSKNGYIHTPDFKVTVSQRDNVKWNSERLMSIKNHFGDVFDSFVKYEIKPDIRKIKAAGGEIEKAFSWAKEITPAQPQVTYEMVTEEEEA